jgi:hypothetical protein
MLNQIHEEKRHVQMINWNGGIRRDRGGRDVMVGFHPYLETL